MPSTGPMQSRSPIRACAAGAGGGFAAAAGSEGRFSAGGAPNLADHAPPFDVRISLPLGAGTHILALLSQRKNKGRLPALGMDASHPESHVDADSVRSVSTLSWGKHFNSFSYFHHGYRAQLSTQSFLGYLTKV